MENNISEQQVCFLQKINAADKISFSETKPAGGFTEKDSRIFTSFYIVSMVKKSGSFSIVIFTITGYVCCRS